MARRYAGVADRAELHNWYHAALVAGYRGRYERMSYAARQFARTHAGWTRASAYKELEQALRDACCWN